MAEHETSISDALTRAHHLLSTLSTDSTIAEYEIKSSITKLHYQLAIMSDK